MSSTEFASSPASSGGLMPNHSKSLCISLWRGRALSAIACRKTPTSSSALLQRSSAVLAASSVAPPIARLLQLVYRGLHPYTHRSQRCFKIFLLFLQGGDPLFKLRNAGGGPGLDLQLPSGAAGSHEGLQSEVLRALQGVGCPSVHQPLLHQREAEGRPGLCQELAFPVTALEAQAADDLTLLSLAHEAPRALATSAGSALPTW